MNTKSLAASLVLGAILLAPTTAGAAPAPAADVALTISGGRVWLKATNATVGQILDEWSRIGQTRIVNGDRVPGGPITLQLENVSEEEALDTLLRSAAGFMGVRRPRPVAANSEFDRILILPKSSAPTNAAAVPRPVEPPTPVFNPPPPAAQSSFFTPGVQRVIGADGQPVPDDQDNDTGSRGVSVAPAPPDAFGAPTAAPNVPANSQQPRVTGSATPGVPVGVAVPGMTVPAPRPQQNPNSNSGPNPNEGGR
jgi:hypothetical protein